MNGEETKQVPRFKYLGLADSNMDFKFHFDQINRELSVVFR